MVEVFVAAVVLVGTWPSMKLCKFQRTTAPPAPITLALLSLAADLRPLLEIGGEHVAIAVIARQ